jgi:ketosteroid isomerase-like protein
MSSLEDELAVRSLLAGYSDAVTVGDPAAAASAFADDAVLQAFGGPEVRGRAAIEAALSSRLVREEGAFALQLSMCVGVRLAPAGDSGHARSHYLELGRGADPGIGRLSTGIMDDTLARDLDGRWRIVRRRLVRSYVGDVDMPGKTSPLGVGAWGLD